jgi:N utilization substance protein A
MDNQKFIAAMKQIAAEKNISEDLIFEAVESAFAAAFRKDFGTKDQEVRVEIQENSPELAKIYVLKEVVEDGDVQDENVEISETDAQKYDPQAELGDEIYIDSTPAGYGRIAAQSAKQVILQKIQEAERKSLFERFKDREGELVTGSVNRVEGNHVFVDIESTTVMLPERHQIRGERYFPGRRMRLYLDKVGISSRGPQLLVSRTHKKLVEGVMEEEIPEVAHGEVEIMAVARDAGFRSKVAVRSDDENVDPVGACIGQRGARIQPVMEELSGERVDVIEWSDNPSVIIARALQPAKIDKVVVVNPENFVDEESGKKVKKRVAVFVEEEERAMAIGRRGQNIRLATDLTGFEIDMYNAEEYEAFMKRLGEMSEGSTEAPAVE